MSQFALPITPGGDANATSIVVGEANRLAVETLGRPQDWPFGTAILSGPPRSGKTMLGRWFAATHGGIVLDDAHLMDDTKLFHQWNSMQERGIPLLFIVSDEEWVIRLPDLRSRLSAAVRLCIGVPDDAMAAELILAHAARRGLALGDEAPTYLVPRIERSFAAIEKLVAVIDRLSLERKTPAKLAIWRSALAIMHGGDGAEDGETGQARLL